MNPSPRSHIYRLLLLLLVLGAAFMLVRALAIPDSWDEQHWFRRDALQTLSALPMRFGGNASCEASKCHEPTKRHDAKLQALSHGKHKTLACEVCHGPLLDHVEEGKKVEHAQISATNDLCLSCHRQLVSRPEKFAQFSETLLYHELLDVREITPCRACHDPHEPK